MTLTDHLTAITDKLPAGWQLLIAINDTGWEVELYDVDGDLVDEFEDDELDADEQVALRLEHAREKG